MSSHVEFPPTRILVPTDFSECSDRSLAYAAEVAARVGAKLLLLHVSPPPPEFGYPLPESAAFQIAEWTRTVRERREAAQEAMTEAMQPFAGMVEIDLRVEEGEAVDSIIRVAEESECDLVVVGSHGRRGLRRAMLGSVAERVVRLSPVPTLVVR
jgi:nucleotide-binding universal stress UspA family protein